MESTLDALPPGRAMLQPMRCFDQASSCRILGWIAWGSFWVLTINLWSASLPTTSIWTRYEFTPTIQTTVANPLDPDQIQVDVTFTSPSGIIQKVPAFWYQAYTSKLVNNQQQLSVSGNPGWRVRFTPQEIGDYTAVGEVKTNGVEVPGSQFTHRFHAEDSQAVTRGFVRVAASRQFFETTTGKPLPLIGANLCWPGSRGTADYADWIPSLAQHRGNFARIWMAPWSLGIECEANTLTRYRLDHAWQLDQVFQLAEQSGIRLLLCLDYHGMFQTTPDFFGGNDQWKINPYNTANKGPCATPNAFFQQADARKIYLKRLRYLIARYGYSPSLLAWECFNEIDNAYSLLTAKDVAAWHTAIADWIHSNDPFHHLVTTSTSGDEPILWSIPGLDFGQVHAYGYPKPTTFLSDRVKALNQLQSRPVLIGEFGVDFRGWMRSSDPYLRGFRQYLWGGALGGSAGTGMSWWWENLYQEGVYSLHEAAGTLLSKTHWGEGTRQVVRFRDSGPPPATVGTAPVSDQTYTIRLVPNGTWAYKSSGRLAVPGPESAGYAPTILNAFVHGSSHSDLKIPFQLSAWFTNKASIKAHVNSVSIGAILTFYVDGVAKTTTSLPDKDGKFDALANEYNIDITLALPTGKHTVEIRNTGGDWFYLDWVELAGVRESTFSGGWLPSPNCIGWKGDSDTLLYVVAPQAVFPQNATLASLPSQRNTSITLSNWASGSFIARWYHPTNAAILKESTSTTTNGLLTLDLPEYSEDLFGVLIPSPKVSQPQSTGASATERRFQFELNAATGYPLVIQRSSDLLSWLNWVQVAPTNQPTVVQDLWKPEERRVFYRVGSIAP